MKFSTPFTRALTMVFMLSPALTEARIGSSSSGIVVVEDTVSVLSSQGQQQQHHRELSWTKPWMSMWENNHGEAPSESSCYADKNNFEPIPNFYYCAVSPDLYLNGDNCGKCYTLTYDGGISHNWDGVPKGARAGSATIQVINKTGDYSRDGDKQFDCLMNGFKDITGLITDGFDITYSEVPCPQ